MSDAPAPTVAPADSPCLGLPVSWQDEDPSWESPFEGWSDADAGGSPGGTVVRPQARPVPESDREEASPWHVVLLDDNEHTFEYVIRMLMQLFGHTVEQALQTAQRVDREGRAICMTTHRELAELKAEQIHGFGADTAIATCVGSMSAIIEPALSGPDDDALSSGDGSGSLRAD